MLAALRHSASPPLLRALRRASSTFGLNEVHQSIKATAAAFANSDLAPNAAAVDRNHSFPKDAVKKMGEMGFMGIPVPTQCPPPPPPPPPRPRPIVLPHSRQIRRRRPRQHLVRASGLQRASSAPQQPPRDVT
jgi:alkylation response protein AidB-like acyl-CoA dehydrogenase